MSTVAFIPIYALPFNPKPHFTPSPSARPKICNSQTSEGKKNNVVRSCDRTPAISAKNVNFTWPNGRRALRDVTFDVRPGELAMIVGRNGCGKSTLLDVLRGLIFPDSGSVHVDSPCSYIRQDPSYQILVPTIGADIALSVPNAISAPKDFVRREVEEALETVGLSPASKFFSSSSHTLSGGQQHRAVLAGALVRKSRSILFDEVTSCIDPLSRADILDRMRVIIPQRTIAGLWVTHVFDELEAADTIIIMDDGRISAMGPRALMMPIVFDMETSRRTD